jgi:transcriptional regulator with XRE-family HTH domain
MDRRHVKNPPACLCAAAVEVDWPRFVEWLTRARRSRTLNDVALEAGVAPSTLARLEQNGFSAMQAETYAALCGWMKVPPSRFVRGHPAGSPYYKDEPLPDRIEALLLRDAELPGAVVDVLSTIMRGAYYATRRMLSEGR